MHKTCENEDVNQDSNYVWNSFLIARCICQECSIQYYSEILLCGMSGLLVSIIFTQTITQMT